MVKLEKGTRTGLKNREAPRSTPLMPSWPAPRIRPRRKDYLSREMYQDDLLAFLIQAASRNGHAT
jgi:hypothetical protein